jgi:hypothetical protein
VFFDVNKCKKRQKSMIFTKYLPVYVYEEALRTYFSEKVPRKGWQHICFGRVPVKS